MVGWLGLVEGRGGWILDYDWLRRVEDGLRQVMGRG